MLWAETVPLDINFSTIAKTPVEWPLSLSRTAAPPANFAVPISREEPEQDVAIHISMVGPVYYEPETLHVAVPFPLSEADLQRHATDMTLSVPRLEEDEFVLTFELTSSDDITPSASEDEIDVEENGATSDDEADESPDLDDGDDRPRNPPPPQPVQRERSRSPRGNSKV
ncbi:hypothetical protein AK812_SmicGene9234 [Symbiodinium microadriaticum]|uniref:Uncharacterized protein n=1 Tax=Symbiodinium microadriaticum TaxID=2951 RepID=A0A1Q9EIX2_SYMMI|nr:hypothetical protein AK812_SmicGene9234 [Symbiodinium microadriaticum]CAE7522363.1 unnamed protein product [Symbiodinium microadriaticum]CAE7892689.1 unnamed protein product [Symbiodinium sp. KB8]